MDMVLQVVHGVLSGLSLAVITWIARKLGMLAARFGAIEPAQGSDSRSLRAGEGAWMHHADVRHKSDRDMEMRYGAKEGRTHPRHAIMVLVR